MGKRSCACLSRLAEGRGYGVALLPEFFEGVEHFEPWAPKVSVVSRRDRQSVASRGRGDVAVLDGHTLAGLIEQSLLVCPDVSDRHVESVDAPVQGVSQPRQPRLERLTLPTVLRAHPIRQVRDDDGVGLSHHVSELVNGPFLQSPACERSDG